jgi:hypothetical protein
MKTGNMISHEEFLRAFEAGELPVALFTHENHVRMAWLYLSRLPFKTAKEKIILHLKNYVKVHGAEGKYHHTLTQAFIYLCYERIIMNEDWGQFKERNEDLFCNAKDVLRYYYSDELLYSAAARESYFQPDKKAFILRSSEKRDQCFIRTTAH